MSNQPIIKEVTINAPVSKVWKAITDRDEMKQWYFDLATFKAEPGFEFRFMGGDECTQYLHLCKVMEVIPNKKLSYSWRYEGIEGESLVTIELFEEGQQTRVRLMHEGVESFKTDDLNFKRESFVAGWDHIIGISLKEFAEAH
jgi:uncharacterized protein YndB with AHSA1/START domain